MAQRLSTSGLAEIFEIPLHVMHVPIGERRGFERCVHVNEPTTWFPSTKGDPALGLVSRALDVFKVASECGSGGRVGASMTKVVQTLVATVLPVLRISLQHHDFHRHGGAKQGDLPRLGGPHDKGGSPKLRRQLAAHLPAKRPHHKAHPLNTPRWSLCARRRRTVMGASRGVSHEPQVRLQSRSNFLLALGLCAEIARAGSGNLDATRIARPTKPGDRS